MKNSTKLNQLVTTENYITFGKKQKFLVSIKFFFAEN